MKFIEMKTLVGDKVLISLQAINKIRKDENDLTLTCTYNCGEVQSYRFKSVKKLKKKYKQFLKGKL